MFGQSSKSVPKKFFAPACRGTCPWEFRPNFSNSSHKWMCVQVWFKSVQWPQRSGVEKK